ncbi:type II toxin-antitoxin system VapC family toxin [bacterium]|nr:type II toxin-antitoxin system VapC family toxin [bacterium]
MIIDTSALLAILFQEDEALLFTQAIAKSPICRMSAVNFLEAAIVIDVHGDAEASRQLDNFVLRAGIEIEAVTLEQAQIARRAMCDVYRPKSGAILVDQKKTFSPKCAP